jgi:hypothetical protein
MASGARRSRQQVPIYLQALHPQARDRDNGTGNAMIVCVLSNSGCTGLEHNAAFGKGSFREVPSHHSDTAGFQDFLPSFSVFVTFCQVFEFRNE